MQHNANDYSTATALAEAANVVFRLPDGGLDNETHWVWDEAGFLHDVSSDIECLRESLTDAITLADCGIVPNQDRLKHWRHVLNKSNA